MELYTGYKKEYHENGNIKEEYYMFQGLYHLLYKSYNEDGTLLREVEYNMGQLSGYAKEYHKNGNIRISRKFYENEPVGIYRKYDEQGNIVDEFDFGQYGYENDTL